MLAGTALYVHLMVYMGLSLFIIRRALRIYGCMRIYAYNLTSAHVHGAHIQYHLRTACETLPPYIRSL